MPRLVDTKAKLHDFILDDRNETVTDKRPAGNIIMPIYRAIRRHVTVTAHHELAKLALFADILCERVSPNDDCQITGLELVIHAATTVGARRR